MENIMYIMLVLMVILLCLIIWLINYIININKVINSYYKTINYNYDTIEKRWNNVENKIFLLSEDTCTAEDITTDIKKKLIEIEDRMSTKFNVVKRLINKRNKKHNKK